MMNRQSMPQYNPDPNIPVGFIGSDTTTQQQQMQQQNATTPNAATPNVTAPNATTNATTNAQRQIPQFNTNSTESTTSETSYIILSTILSAFTRISQVIKFLKRIAR